MFSSKPSIANLSFVSFPCYDTKEYPHKKKKIYFTDTSIRLTANNRHNKTLKNIERFKQERSLSELCSEEGRLYTPITNGELKYFHVTNSQIKVYKENIHNRAVIIIKHQDIYNKNYETKALLYSVAQRKTQDTIVLGACLKNHTVQTSLKAFADIIQNTRHPFNSKINNESYEEVAKSGLFPGYNKGIHCSGCDFFLEYNNLTKDTSKPQQLINAHKNFFMDRKTKKITLKNNNHILATPNISYCKASSRHNMSSLLYLHKNNKTTELDHYHPILINKSNFDYHDDNCLLIDYSRFYFGKFNLETFDDYYIQQINKLNVKDNLIAETAV